MINQDEALEQNQRILALVGWKEFQDEDWIWYESLETGEWSWDFPGSVIKDLIDLIEQKLLNQPVVAEAPPVVDKELTPPRPPPPSSSSSSHSGLPPKAPPPPRDPPPPIENQQALGSLPPFAKGPTNINRCSWHRTPTCTGHQFTTVNNGCKHVGYLILTDEKLSSALTSLENTLFRDDPTGFEDFRCVIRHVFRQGMVQITHYHRGGGYIGVELMCKCCCTYVIVENVNSKWGKPPVLQAARATLLSFIVEGQFNNPQLNLLQQRRQNVLREQFERMD